MTTNGDGNMEDYKKRLLLLFALKKVVLVMALLLAPLFAQNVAAEFSTINGLTISNATFYSPYPAEPGKYFDLYVRIQYTGTVDKAYDVVCTMSPTFPFSIDTGDPIVSNIGTLAPYQEVMLKYRIRVDQNTVQGTNKLNYRCSTRGYAESMVELPIYVQAHDAILEVGSVSSVPYMFKPGQAGTVTVSLDNIASVSLKDITVKLDLSGSDIPFAPINGTTEKRVDMIETGKSVDVPFSVMAFSDATPKVYKVPITLAYFDSLGKNYSKSVLTSLLVKTEPSLMMVHEQTTVVKNGSKNSVTISIVNRGLSQVKFMTAVLADSASGEYQILTPKQVYVGDINSDDSETAEYDLFISTDNDRITLPLTVAYEDTLGNSYTETENVPVNVFNSQTAVQFGLEKAVTADPIMMGAAGLVFLYVLYRVFKAVTGKKKQ
ncbi:Uncharacterised protein [uncultured archaeon]|nr:Uncharacterised protein [uncultured archaeon]